MTTQTTSQLASGALASDSPRPAALGPVAVALAAAATLDQFAAFARLTPADVYSASSDRLRGGTIGKHLRHTIDHFRAAVVGAATGQRIDYDHRERETRIETDAEAAVELIDELARTLRAYDESTLAQRVEIEVMLTGSGEIAHLETTLARELAFAAHHAVHHAAMLKAIALEFGFEGPARFGMAPSTLHYEQSRSA
ncbi:MAG: DinB family protein [Planctomycetota bacterium]